MSNNKRIVKKPPFAWYEVDALEAWLDEQVQQGLRLVAIKGFGTKKWVFEKSHDAPTRYRVHIKPKNGYYTRREEYKETMRELGWEYVDRLNYRVDIYRATRPDAVEINTDEETLRGALRSTILGGVIGGILLLCFMVPYTFRQNFPPSGRSYGGFYDILIGDGLLPFLFPVFISAVWAVIAVFGIFRAVRQQRRYLLGRSFLPDPEARKRKRIQRMLFILCGIAILAAAVDIKLIAGNGMSVAPSTCPVALLEYVAPEEASRLKGKSPSAHSYTYPLSSCLTYEQSGPVMRVDGFKWSYPSFCYQVRVRDIRTEFLAEKYYAEKTAGDDWQEVPIDGWDQAMYRRSTVSFREELGYDTIPESLTHPQQDLMLHTGSRVIEICYTGEADIYPRLNALYGK